MIIPVNAIIHDHVAWWSQWYTLDSGRLEITSGLHACTIRKQQEGRLLHDWFTSKHRLISVVSSSPSQAVSPESSVSEELPCVISTHVNGDMHTCKQDCGTMTKKTVIENRNTANTQPASIIMNSASQQQASPRRQSHHAEHIQSTASMLARCTIRNHAASHAVFYRSFCFPILPFPVMHPFLWSVAAETRYEAEITETVKHTASEYKPCQQCIHSSCELHHDPFLGYNHEWYGTVHAHHVSLSLPICMENIFG